MKEMMQVEQDNLPAGESLLLDCLSASGARWHNVAVLAPPAGFLLQVARRNRVSFRNRFVPRRILIPAGVV
jgi:hypothetical protein